MKVLYVATEVSPFIKVGGLGDVAGSLPIALHKLGVDIRIAVPRYKKLNTEDLKLKKENEFSIIFNWKKEKVRVYKVFHPEAKVPVYFFENNNYLSNGGDYIVGNHKERVNRFAFFSKAVAEWLKIFEWKPEIVHINDWHPSLIGVLPHEGKVVLTLHNHASNEFPKIGSLRYMLSYPVSNLGSLGALSNITSRKSGVVNLLLNGVKAADFVNAVSPTYAKEIVRSRFCGGELSRAFFEKEEAGKLTGILNGIDQKVFDPKTDKYLAKNYSVLNWEEGKAKNKKSLLKLCGWKDDGKPVMGFVARFTKQKGIDLMINALERIRDGFSVVMLGTGNEEIINRVMGKIGEDRERYVGFFKFDLEIASLIYGGCDMFLAPSRFEPCGLTQMIAMRYGTVPIVRKTGGLADTVTEGENGFVFAEFRVRSLERAIKRACATYKDKVRWKRMVERGMKEDFSWDKASRKYLEMYEKVIKF